MKQITNLLLCVMALLMPGAVSAEIALNTDGIEGGARIVSTERWVEEWDPAAQRWVRVSDAVADSLAATAVPVTTEVTTTRTAHSLVTTQTTTILRDAARFQAPIRKGDQTAALAQYGPFRVLDTRRAVIVGSTSASAPQEFDAMLRDFPGLEVLEMIEAPGTSHDLANLSVGRRIRAAGLATHVPAGGSVRSGAVELFLAGAFRTIDQGAEFAVHSWLDEYGREPDDFAANAPENRLYLDYYEEMGMSEDRARDFYAMTNSVPHHSALWLEGREMRDWIEESEIVPTLAPKALANAVPSISYEQLGSLPITAIASIL